MCIKKKVVEDLNYSDSDPDLFAKTKYIVIQAVL